MIEAAHARGDWEALQRDVLALLARERDLSATNALPSGSEVDAAAKDFRYTQNLLTADELSEWLDHCGLSVDEWLAELRRSLFRSAEPEPVAVPPDVLERASWVHAVCSGRLAEYARTFAEEIAVQLTGQLQPPASEQLVAMADVRRRFCEAQLDEAALEGEVRNNNIGWTRLDLQYFTHHDEMVLREAALCVQLDGRELADVANDAGAESWEASVLLVDVPPTLQTRLLAASVGQLIGPLAAEAGHQLILLMRRRSPTVDDPVVRRRAEQTIIERALRAAVNRHVRWHEHL
ncbi:hypothetical protein [Mycolicibacterium rhodesiae]|uniref:hypothetical protein n=1 Tax=Mycolicibacterium rhodesiae TaxID=36814 RepID=UPI0002E39F37|nr:hypothetical protein [Mycolicibacterium rhodesiae]